MEDERLEDTEKDLALTVGDIEEVKERLSHLYSCETYKVEKMR